MTKEKFPVTSAIRFLRDHQVDFVEHLYQYEEHGGTERAAKELGVDEHLVIKTLVMEDDEESPFIILMHGDKEVSTKTLARTIGVKAVNPCTPEAVHLSTQAIGWAESLHLEQESPFQSMSRRRFSVSLKYLSMQAGRAFYAKFRLQI